MDQLTPDSSTTPAALIKVIRDKWASPIRTFKEDRRSQVRCVAHGDQQWVVKRYAVGGIKLRGQRLLGASPAQRETRGAAVLADLGVRCSEPIISWRDRGEWIVLPYVEGLSLHHWLGQRGGPSRRGRVLESVGRQAGELTCAGWINRDFKPSNLIIDEACEEDGLAPVMIDALGLRRRRSDSQIVSMLNVFVRACQRQQLVSETEKRLLIEAMSQADPSIDAPKLIAATQATGG